MHEGWISEGFRANKTGVILLLKIPGVFIQFQGSPSYELQRTVEGCALVMPLVLSALSKAHGAD